MPFDSILEQLKPLPQFTILRKKDLINIKNSYFLSNFEHPNVCSSVNGWVAKAVGVVRYVKLAGKPCKFGLKDEDTLLVIATNEQVSHFFSHSGVWN